MRINEKLALVLLILVASSSLAAPPPNPVVHAGQPVVSPQGDRIAFLSNRSGAQDVYIVGVKGAGEKQLTHTPEDENGLQWINGKELAFSVRTGEKSRLIAIDAKGKSKREVGEFIGRAPMLSPDGKRVVSMGGTWTATRLTISEVGGAGTTELTDGSSIEWNMHWSPDGKRIAFTGRKEMRGDLAVFVMNADGSERRQVSNMPSEEGGAQWPVWSPDGSRLAVQVNSRAVKGSAFLWVIDVETGEGRKLGEHDHVYVDETPSWFPDGKRIAFQSNRTGSMEVWVIIADGTGPRQVTRAE